MTRPNVGERVKARYEDIDYKYTLDVVVTATRQPDEFTGRVERVFAAGEGEITGGRILGLKGQELTF
jgi:hypothetical protein